ncbi:MAG: hypothetical protein GKS07_09955 [Nitrosopumilus sp.]|nr:MAG: hypothetical protein GKS07_09955 [Nitrosopumilus sp.]
METSQLMIMGISLIVVFAIVSFAMYEKYLQYEEAKQSINDMPCEKYLSADFDRNAEFNSIHEQKLKDCLEEQKRFDLKEIVYASTTASRYWRGELFEMWNDKTHDYKHDPIFLEAQEFYFAKNRCIDLDHVWNDDGTCTLTTVHPNVSGMGLKYGKYVAGIENED